MSTKTDNVPHGFHNPSEPISDKLFPSEDPNRHDVAGSVMDGLVLDVKTSGYAVYKTRWLMLAFFVLYSASNSLQWTQYTIISDIIVKYYSVKSHQVSWTSMVYMVSYVPLIFPASWLLDRTCQLTLVYFVSVIMSAYIVAGAWYLHMNYKSRLHQTPLGNVKTFYNQVG